MEDCAWCRDSYADVSTAGNRQQITRAAAVTCNVKQVARLSRSAFNGQWDSSGAFWCERELIKRIPSDARGSSASHPAAVRVAAVKVKGAGCVDSRITCVFDVSLEGIA